MNRDFAAIPRFSLEALRNHREGTAHTGEAGRLAETAELDRDVPGAVNFIDRVRNGRVGDVGFIGGVIQNHRTVLLRVFDPTLQHLLGGNHAGRVIRIAQVNQVDPLPGKFRNEIVGGGNRKVNQAAVAATGIRRTRVSGHDVGIHVHRIYRIQHRDDVVFSEDIQDIPRITLGTVRDEDLIRVDLGSACLIIVFGNGLAQEIVALFGPIAAERRAFGQLVDGRMHRLNHGGGKRFGDVADAQANDVRGRVLVAECLHPPADFRKQVAGGQLEIMLIDIGHNRLSKKPWSSSDL